MPVDTKTDVEEVSRVLAEDGESRAPATERAARQICKRGDVSTATTAGEYPIEYNPDVPVHEVLVIDSGADAVLEITTTGGDEFTIPLRGKTMTLNRWEVDSFKVTNQNDQTTTVGWAGE